MEGGCTDRERGVTHQAKASGAGGRIRKQGGSEGGVCVEGGNPPTCSLFPLSASYLFFFHTPPPTPQSLGYSRLYIPVPRLSPSARGGLLLSCPPRKQAVLSKKSRIKTTVFRYLQTQYILLENQERKKNEKRQICTVWTCHVSPDSVPSS